MSAHESSGRDHRADEGVPADKESSLTRDVETRDPESVFDAAPCGFISFSDDGVVSEVNRTLLEMIGYQRADIVGKHIEQLFNVGTRIFYQTHWFPLLRLHGRAEEVFLMLRTQSGEDVGVLSYARRQDHGRYHCVLVPVRERAKYEEELLRARRAAEAATAELVTQKAEVERANEQLEAQAIELELQGDQLREQAEHLEQMAVAADEANRAKSRFLAMMSHELRTPLNAISGYLQILELGIAGPITEAQRDILERLDRSGRHLLGVINDVLDLSRIEAGRIDYQVSDVVLADVVSAAATMVEPQLAAKAIDFRVSVPRDIVVRADGEKLRQIVLNLLGNALKFTPGKGAVDVSAELVQDAKIVLIRVHDTGIGIPREKLEAVFQPFVQVDSERTRAVQGSGLGLAIARDFARGMGGDLVVESALGKGSTFTLSVPSA